MSRNEISHEAAILGLGLLYLHYKNSPAAIGHPHSKEEVCWKVFCRAADGQAVPLVMLNASPDTWQQEPVKLRADVAALIQLHSKTMGRPTTCSDTIVSNAHHAAWVLCQPGGQYAFVLLSPGDGGMIGPESVSFQPVFSVDSRVGRSSLAALELIFPQVATAAAEAVHFG